MPKKKGVTEAYLDGIFSTYIRLRDADEWGMIKCCNYMEIVTTPKPEYLEDGTQITYSPCLRRVFWKDATNGHFVKRRHRTLRWDERNCHAECAPCNAQDTNLGYADFMVEKYGPEIWQILTAQKNNRGKITPHERKIMADNYKHKIKQLKKEKGL